MDESNPIYVDLGQRPIRSVLQPWVERCTMMQQSVLLAAIRGADGTPKFHKSKMLVRFLRRSILVSAFDGKALNDPWHDGGGSFTGPSLPREVRDRYVPLSDGTYLAASWLHAIGEVVDDFIDSRDEMSLHYYAHAMHAVEVIGYKHSDKDLRTFWHGVYERMVHALHLWPETEEQMDRRLGDNPEGWKAREDPSSNCSM